MHSNKLVVAVKSRGQVLREFGESVLLPFGSEYSILLKNLNSKRASVKVWIDGSAVTGDCSLVIDPNDSIELERFIKNGNLTKGNRFKFLERTAAVEAHRGIKAEDGLLRIELQYEADCPVYVKPIQQWPAPWNGSGPSWPTLGGDNHVLNNSVIGSRYLNSKGLRSASSNAAYAASSVGAVATASSSVNGFPPGTTVSHTSQEGFTAPGSVSDQAFQTVSSFALEAQIHVIVLKLQGAYSEKVISKPVTVRSRTSCTSCGKREASSAKFCSRCGTGLQLVD